MPKNTQEERLRWIKPILLRQISIKNMAMASPFSERTLKYWLANYRREGAGGLIPLSTRPKSQAKETPIRAKERIIELRKETNLSALKLSWRLRKEGLNIHHRTIGKILKQEDLVRKYRTRKMKCRYVKALLLPGELVEIDIKYVPQSVGNQRYYQFTAIDCASRWRYLKIYDSMGTSEAMDFLGELMKVAPFKIRAIKTDNGSCFTNRYTGYLKSSDLFNPKLHELDLMCRRLNIRHYLIDPGKPAQNGKVERSHRSDQETFYDRVKFATIEELRYKIRLWNMYYNDLEHCALNGLTPNQALGLRVQNVYS